MCVIYVAAHLVCVFKNLFSVFDFACRQDLLWSPAWS